MQPFGSRRNALRLIGVSALSYAVPGTAAEDWTVRIVRTSFNSDCLTGELYVNGKFLCHSLERPWKNNKSYISAIPDGTYSADLRYDKPDKWRIQLKNVPGRTFVQLLVGNVPSRIEGCVLVGQKAITRQNKLEGSAVAYARLRESFYGSANPVATPNVTTQVKIDYVVGRTEVSNGERTLRYQDEGRWRMNGAQLTEISRDLAHVYLKPDDGTPVIMRIPLFGGLGEAANSLNGPWVKQDGPPFKRMN